MPFFPDEPEAIAPDEPEPEQRPWWNPPEDELPGILAVSEIVASSEHVALALLAAHVHSTGVELQLERHLRRGGLGMTDWHRLTNRSMEHMGEDEPAERLRHGLVLPNGERVVEGGFGAPGFDPMQRPEGFSLVRRGGGGGGGGRSYASSERLWLWPLPPAGAIELVMQWPSMSIGESRVVVDLSGIDALAAAARPMWQDAAAR